MHQQFKRQFWSTAAVAAIVLAGGATPALAQIDEIVVSAQKREESQQDVPLAITALDDKLLDESSIDNSFELSLKTPSLVLTANGSNGQPYIRGVGTDIINPGTESSVAVNFANIYLPRPDGSITEFFDLNRIEVVKGPQGTLYGRNATAGAINIIPERPGDEFEAYISGIYGSYDRARVEGAVNVPLTDRLAVRASGVFVRRDGYIDNLTLNRTEDDEDLWGGRLQAQYDDGEKITILAGVEWVREDSSRGGITIPEYDPAIPAFALGARPTSDPYTTYANIPGEVDRDHLISFLDATIDLGDVKFRSITGYVKTQGENYLDLDGTEIEFARDIEQTRSKSFTQEFQLLSDSDGPLQWVAGLYYLHEKANQIFPLTIFDGLASQTYVSSNNVDAFAVFGQGTYNITDQWRLTLGGRYSYEDKEGAYTMNVTDLAGGILLPAPGVIDVANTPSEHWGSFTPRVAIEYRIDDARMVYASYSRGFKSGGFNLNGAGEIFDPEKISSYEVGLRAEWLDSKVRTNLTGFYYDYSDLQVNYFDGVITVIDNAAAAEIYGLEGELLASPNEYIDFDFGVTWLDATYDEYLFDGVTDLSGNRMPRAPKVTATGGLQFNVPIPNVGKATFRGDFRYQSDVFYSQLNDPRVAQDSFILVNTRAALALGEEGKIELAFYGENLTKEVYRQNVIPVPGVLGNLQFFGAPRVFGAQVTLRY